MKSISDWLIGASSALLLTVVTGSWLGSIRTQKPGQMNSSRWFAIPAWAQVILGLVAITLFIWFGLLLWNPLPLRLPDAVIALAHPIGLAIFLVGLFLALWARWALGAMYGVSTGSSAPLQERHRLIQGGPYAFSRHPMYLGYWLVMLGVLLTYRTWTPLLLLIMTIPSFHRRARREEISLGEIFGEEWQTYVKHVPMFLPDWKINRRR
jgi:protein-S-isoprenylcysteine O-methyltransferase Ste14